MEHISLKAHNYKYSEKQGKTIKNKLEFLSKQIPCNSRIFLDFEYKDKAFSGKLMVNFNGKSFFSTDKDEMLASLTGSLCKKIQKQVMKWKKSRTLEEITGIIALKPSAQKKTANGLSAYRKIS